MIHIFNSLYWCSDVNPQKLATLQHAVQNLQVIAEEEFVFQILKSSHIDMLIISDQFQYKHLIDIIERVKKRFRNLAILVEQPSYKNREALIRNGASDILVPEVWHADFLGHLFFNSVKFVDLERQRRESVFQFKKLEHRLNTIMKNTPVILFMLDAEGKFTMGTGKLFDKFKVDKQFVLGQKLEEIYIAYPSFIKAYQSARNGEIQKMNLTLNEVVFEVVLTPVVDKHGEVNEIFGIASDVTERVESEKSLLKGKKMAEEAAKVKQEFIANMSHEIRTPLNAIIGFVNLLYDSSLNEVQLDHVASAKMASENLMSLINSILDFSKIENGTLKHESEEFNLKHVINSIDKVLSLKVLEKKIGFHVEVKEEVPVELVGDPNRLYQIVTNLLANAVKFTERGSVELIVDAGNQTLDKINIEFKVVDTGIGIPEHMQSKIFDSFTQVNSESNRKYGGTGLGLSIVKRIVEQLQGTITLESRPFRGTTFKVVLPFKVAENPEARKRKLTKIKGDLKLPTGKRILLAEDNLMNQKLVLQLLRNFEVQVDLAETGLEAVKAHQSNNYDLILMDIQMPEMDGLEATVMIRNKLDEDRKHVPIVAMTAHAFQEELDKCIEVGMNDHIIKPIDVGLFIHSLNKALATSDDQQGVNFNLSYLREMFGDDQLVINDILQTFTMEAPDLIAEMMNCSENRDFEGLAKQAHKAKSSFKMVGMDRAVELIQELENAAKNGEERSIKMNIAAVDKAYQLAAPLLRVDNSNEN